MTTAFGSNFRASALIALSVTIFGVGCSGDDDETADRSEIYQPIAPILLVSDSLAEYDEARSRLTNLLDGMGLQVEIIEHKHVPDQQLSNYQLAIVAGPTTRQFLIDQPTEEAIIHAISRGLNVLWIGSGMWGTYRTTNLPDAFGIRYVEQGWSTDMNIATAHFANMAGQPDALTVYKENVLRTEPKGATVEGWYQDSDGT